VKTRTAAELPIWGLVGLAGLAGTVALAAAQGSRGGCATRSVGDLISVGGIAGVGLAVATLLMVGAVPRYRSAGPAIGAILALAVSIFAVVSYLTSNSVSCF
jgi:hypothetical protein